MDLLKTILLYMTMLYISAVQVAPDPATVNITPTPGPTQTAIYATADIAMPQRTPTSVPTPSITANPAYGTLVLGDRSDTVKKVQQKLQELGYYTDEIDSAYGNKTRRAVEQFQSRNGLTVDGIAGKYTQTILFESADVKAAPTPTPPFLPDETLTPPPMTSAPPETVTPPPASTPEPTIMPEQTETPVANTPVLLDRYGFVLSGYSEPLTVQDTDFVLHPAELDEAIFVPLTEILRNAGNVIVTNSNGSLEEIAFTVLTDFYQVSYTVTDNGTLNDLVFEKNAQPQPLQNRSAILLDDVFYLPLEDMARITGIGFTMDDAAGIITVTMPVAGT